MRSFILLAALLAVPLAVPAQEYALEQLNTSPRHHEWATIPSGDRNLHAFVAYPENATDSVAAIVIHENRGLTDWVRSFADQLAGAGILAVAPDLLSGFDEKHDRTAGFADSDAARSALYQLDADQVTQDLKAVQNYIRQLPSANGKIVVMGFCWGGSQTFRFVTNTSDLSAALVFYGSAPRDSTVFDQISAPVHGFYGGNDQRINSRIPETDRWMEAAGKAYDYVIYEGAGHAFMRRGDDPADESPNKKARNEAWVRLRKLISEIP